MPLIRKPHGTPPVPPVDLTSVLNSLQNGNNDERWTAARAVAELPGGAKALGNALMNEPDARVREAIFTGLARICTAECIELMLSCLRSDDAQLRTGALDALRTTKTAVQPYMAQLIDDHDADVRLLACELARNLPGKDAARLLCDLLDCEPQPNVCASAVEVLAEVGDSEALPALARCADRFRGTAFLEFSIKITADLIRSQTAEPRG